MLEKSFALCSCQLVICHVTKRLNLLSVGYRDNQVTQLQTKVILQRWPEAKEKILCNSKPLMPTNYNILPMHITSKELALF